MENCETPVESKTEEVCFGKQPNAEMLTPGYRLRKTLTPVDLATAPAAFESTTGIIYTK